MSYLSWVLSVISLMLTGGVIGAYSVHRLDEAWPQTVFLASVIATLVALEWDNRKNTLPGESPEEGEMR
jgi:uncharacterized membrane protein YfcA